MKKIKKIKPSVMWTPLDLIRKSDKDWVEQPLTRAEKKINEIIDVVNQLNK